MTGMFININITLSQDKVHYEGVMKNKVLPDIKEADVQYQELKSLREVLIISYYYIEYAL